MKNNSLFILSLFLIHACASPGTLGGGSIDQTPPIVKSSNLDSINFKGNQVVIELDEYFVLDNPKQNIQLFPSHSTISSKINKKTLILEFDSALKENTTYTLIADQCIKDNNAGNVLNYSRTFSTGNSIDTNYIKIEVQHAKAEKDLFLALVETNVSDSLRNFKTDYLYKVNKTNFIFNGLKNKKYAVWLFSDANGDKKPDWYQPMNFVQNLSVDTNIVLKTEKWNKPFEILNAKTDGKFTKVYYSKNNFYYKYLFELFGNQLNNAVYYDEDSALIENLNYAEITPDTIAKINVSKEIEAYVLKTLKVIQMKNNKLVIFNAPQILQKNNFNSKILRQQVLINNMQDSFFIESTRFTEPLLIYVNGFRSTESKKLSFFDVKINSSIPMVFDIKIIKDGEEYLSLYDSPGIDLFIEPGTYTVEVYERSYLNPFNPFELKNRSALIYTKVVSLRASWEEILNINID